MANQSATLTKEKPRATHEAPTDLSREGVAAITAARRHLLADSFALYLKTKNFHWHMTGRHFRDYHLLLVTPAAESVCGDCGRSRRMKS